MHHNAIKPQTIYVECVINQATGNLTFNTNNFNQQDQLIDRPIVGLQSFSATDMPFSPISNLPVIPDNVFTCAFLNIQRSGVEPLKSGVWFKNIPLCSMRSVYNVNSVASGTLDEFWVDPMTIQWPDSNVFIPVPQSMTVAKWAVPFMITYLLKEQDPIYYTQAYLKAKGAK